MDLLTEKVHASRQQRQLLLQVPGIAGPLHCLAVSTQDLQHLGELRVPVGPVFTTRVYHQGKRLLLDDLDALLDDV